MDTFVGILAADVQNDVTSAEGCPHAIPRAKNNGNESQERKTCGWSTPTFQNLSVQPNGAASPDRLHYQRLAVSRRYTECGAFLFVMIGGKYVNVDVKRPRVEQLENAPESRLYPFVNRSTSRRNPECDPKSGVAVVLPFGGDPFRTLGIVSGYARLRWSLRASR